ncbi:hypothetical protein LNV09_23735 [Paucibacter sp. B2R-40]|uniref:glucosamine inositolphosphorylceramide transferase family protein n=1 Tax=Paucibacter sp. B2R-40 TaxID=2893554 RepID=UPI0021E4909D|nr:hypothetical protein [Paucibacter sp. B2R-40]MCV2357167.1 hypothetical protein [Paucibacter sp. B2R-40]
MKDVIELAYRWLDRQMFRASQIELSQATKSLAAWPDWQLSVGGLPLAQLEDGVRAYIGSGLTIPIEIRCGQSRELIYTAQAWIEHRSLRRSMGLVLAKLPAVLAKAQLVAQTRPQSLPGPATQLRSASPAPSSSFRLIYQLLRDAIRSVLMREQWVLAVGRWGDKTDKFLVTAVIEPPGDRFWADPFVTELAGKRWLLFEELVFKENRGKIAAVELGEQGQIIGSPRLVLDLPYHLSYPFLLEDAGKLYMIPESSANRTVDLYVNGGSIETWTKVATLLSGERWADATVIQYEGKWWMFAARGDAGASIFDELVIFWAHDLLGPWQAHAANPVKIDAQTVRPAGAMWVEDGALHRVVQDCSARYGAGVRVQRVTELSATSFFEEDLGPISWDGSSEFFGLHTLSTFGSTACVDLLRRIPVFDLI